MFSEEDSEWTCCSHLYHVLASRVPRDGEWQPGWQTAHLGHPHQQQDQHHHPQVPLGDEQVKSAAKTSNRRK